jgi:hypothetical protein
MSLDMDVDLQERLADAAALPTSLDLQDRPAGPTGPDRGADGSDGHERPEGEGIPDGGSGLQGRPDAQVSLDRLADVINDVLAVPPAEGLALLLQTQVARAAAPERADLAALPEAVGT